MESVAKTEESRHSHDVALWRESLNEQSAKLTGHFVECHLTELHKVSEDFLLQPHHFFGRPIATNFCHADSLQDLLSVELKGVDGSVSIARQHATGLQCLLMCVANEGLGQGGGAPSQDQLGYTIPLR